MYAQVYAGIGYYARPQKHKACKPMVLSEQQENYHGYAKRVGRMPGSKPKFSTFVSIHRMNLFSNKRFVGWSQASKAGLHNAACNPISKGYASADTQKGYPYFFSERFCQQVN